MAEKHHETHLTIVFAASLPPNLREALALIKQPKRGAPKRQKSGHKS
jgi:hypothetical protein